MLKLPIGTTVATATIKREFALLHAQTLTSLFHLVYFVKCFWP